MNAPSGAVFDCPAWPQCGCPDGTMHSTCPGLSRRRPDNRSAFTDLLHGEGVQLRPSFLLPDVRSEPFERNVAMIGHPVDLDFRPPLRLSDRDIGVVVDADGRDIFVVDVNGERTDAQTAGIAAALVFLVNDCLGAAAPPSAPIAPEVRR